MKPTIELLAPSGNMECLKAAVLAGADDVYLGLGKFNARIKADNFDFEVLMAAVDFAHERGVKIYTVFNTLLKQAEVSKAVDEIERASEIGVDAFIIQDFGLLHEIKKRELNIKIHASTQMGIHNLQGARVAERLGISRIILSRETLREDIKAIKEGTNLEIESFVHGAMCVGFSGNCYFSSMLAGESGNRGRCLQLCRKGYSYNKNGEKKYLLSPKDLCLVENLNDLVKLGVTSFKIEGRNRRAEYVGEVVSIYRKALDGGSFGKPEKDRLKVAFNRGDFTGGYVIGKEEKIIYDKHPSHIGLRVGVVVSISSGERTRVPKSSGDHWSSESIVKIKYDNNVLLLTKGDGIKFMRSGIEVGTALIGNPNNISYKGNVKVGDEVRLTSRDKRIYNELELHRRGRWQSSRQSVGAVIDRVNVELPICNFLPITKPTKFVAVNSVNQITDYLYNQSDYIVLNPTDYSIKTISGFGIKAENKAILNLPNIMRGQDKKILLNIINNFESLDLSGFIVNNLWGIEVCKNYPIILGTGLNILNTQSYQLFCGGDTLPPALYSYITSIESPIPHPNAINYIYGYPPLLTLCHCVEKGTTGSHCSPLQCGKNKNIFDDRGIGFKLNKRKLTNCYHELLNSTVLDNRELLADKKYSVYIDLSCEQNPTAKLKEILTVSHNSENHTHGNYKRGLK